MAFEAKLEFVPLDRTQKENIESLLPIEIGMFGGSGNYDPTVIESAEFLAGVSWMVLHGTPPVQAMEETSHQKFKKSPIFQWVKEGVASKETQSLSAVARFGQSCHVTEALPGVVHLIAKHEENLKEALVEAVMAGGDSAARGMAIGMVLVLKQLNIAANAAAASLFL